ncbi:hypothetical protein ACBY01_02090 [Sphingomonas sp. ac-8]|uniref:hypothetical protein n=1 Tax=Sphingomonas sp. ac-8 TaxID=3242977 RepID=UPI003A813D41
MERVILFNLLHLLATAYAVGRGGAPERFAGMALLLATLATRVAQRQFPARFASVEWGVFGVDLVLLVALLVIALFADRFWPLWVTALHGLGTCSHFVKLLDLEVLRTAYATLSAVWSYPILILLVSGTVRHQQRLRRAGSDPDWSRPGAAAS